MASKMEVLYGGDIWTSHTWINQSMFKQYTDMYPMEKMIIARNGICKNVEIKDLKFVSKPKKERRKNEQQNFYND